MGMKVRVNMGDGFDLIEVGDWLQQHCPDRYIYSVIEIAWEVERTDDDPWFQMEVEFTEEQDATMFLLRWS
jgi:hypothetical protein